IKQLLVDLAQTDNENKRQTHRDAINQITTQRSDLTRELLLISELDNAQHLTFSDNIQLNILIKEIIRHEHFALDNKSLMIMSNLESIYFLGNERILHQAIN
ncbi:two-component sensor histidine kinase, partial [Staphylococcus pasteuri_A]|nr:two-component sensor histidine kinase [Staphylococcus pasteuri_A]